MCTKKKKKRKTTRHRKRAAVCGARFWVGAPKRGAHCECRQWDDAQRGLARKKTATHKKRGRRRESRRNGRRASGGPEATRYRAKEKRQIASYDGGSARAKADLSTSKKKEQRGERYEAPGRRARASDPPHFRPEARYRPRRRTDLLGGQIGEQRRGKPSKESPAERPATPP